MFRPFCRSLSRIAVAGLLLACASASFALPITLSAGQSAGFNFLMDNEGITPPFQEVRTTVVFSGFDFGDVGTVVWFGGLDLQVPTVFTFTNSGSGPDVTFIKTLSDSSIMDGLFSVNVTATSGSITLESLTSVGYASEVDTGTQLPSPINPNPNRVPEPTTGALVVLALACAGMVFRRRSAAQAILA